MADAKRILLVEDDVDQAALFEQFLRNTGYLITTVEDGQQALDALTRAPFDLVITDWYLPEIKGDALIRRIKATYPAVKTVLMSSHGHVREAAVDCGADGALQKGDFRGMLSLVASLLASA